ncbi:acyl-CoA thioesterase [Microbulbifer sp. THAF38]|uniref:acyl-CoA thioesterase n=1 Tax=unclassified Microbulbifer TaxID=2619833 RepID=UPI0012682D3E|nr:hotdog domain-containing protein [Microbulbifer sp. THAF38]QFT53712.1 acyl-CoA esterase [Microbulbifer sp. THAF38]
MKYYSRHCVKPGDLNPAQRLFGGQLLAWIDEEAAIFAGCQMGTPMLVTKLMSEIDFVSSACCGDVVEFGFEVVGIGQTSLTVHCEVRSKQTQQLIVQVEQIVFVALDANGKPTPHAKAGMTLEQARTVTLHERELRERRLTG